MDDAKDAEIVYKSEEDAVKDELDSDSYFGFESPSRATSPDLEFVGEFTPFEDLSRKVVENYKSNLPRRSGGAHQRKFFKGKASKVVPEDAVDVEKVLKLISDKSVGVETVKGNCKLALKTYGNRRKSSYGQLVESFGLPDDPIITSTIANDSSSICIDLQDDGTDDWVVDDFKVENLEVKDEPGCENRLACGVYNPFYRDKLHSRNKNEYHSTTGNRVQNNMNFMSFPSSNQVSKMIKIDYCKPSPKKTVIQPVEVLNIRPQPVVIDMTPVNTEAKSQPTSKHAGSSLEVKSQKKSESAEVTIELFLTEKKSENLTPVLEILPAKSVHDAAKTTKPVVAVETKIDEDVIEVIDLIEEAPKQEPKRLKQLLLQPDVTIEIEPNKASLHSQEKMVKSDIKSLTKQCHARSTLQIQRPKSPELTIELEPIKASVQLETINLTEDEPKPEKPVKSKKTTIMLGTAKSELEMLQNETENIAQELATSILLSAKEEKLIADIALEPNKPDVMDLVKNQSEIVKAGTAETKSRRSRTVKSQPEVVAPKLDSDTTSYVKVEATSELKLQQSKSSEVAVNSPSSTIRSTKSRTRSAKPVLDILPQSSPKSDAVETKSSRKSRSVIKSQLDVAAPNRESHTKSPVKQEHAGTSEASTIRSTNKRLRNSEPAFDIPPKFSIDIAEPESKSSETVESTVSIHGTKSEPCSSKSILETSPEPSKIVKSNVVETKGRRSRSVKFQLEALAPSNETRNKSPVKVEHTDMSKVRLEESKCSAESSTIRSIKKKPRNSEPASDIPTQSPGICKTDVAETKSRRSRTIKSQPEVVTPKQEAPRTKSPVKAERSNTLEVNLESKLFVEPSTIYGAKRKPRNPEPVSDTPPQPPVKTDAGETKSMRTRSVKTQPEVVALKDETRDKSPVKVEHADASGVASQSSKSSELVEGSSTIRSTKKRLRKSEPVLDIPPKSPIDIVESESKFSEHTIELPSNRNTKNTPCGSKLVLEIPPESSEFVKSNVVDTKSRRLRLVKSKPEVVAPIMEALTSPVKEEQEPDVKLDESKSSAEPSLVRSTKNEPQNSQPVLDILAQFPITDAAETRGRRSRSVKFQPEVAASKREGRTTLPVKKELKPEVRLEEVKSSAEPSTVLVTKNKPQNSGPVLDVLPQFPITDAAETRGRRSRSVKFQPEVASKREDRTTTPVKKELKSEVRLEEATSSAEPSTVRSTKNKHQNSEPVLDIRPQFPTADAVEIRGRRSRSVKLQPEAAASKRKDTSPVKKELKPEEARPSTVLVTKNKPQNSKPGLDIQPQFSVTDAAETRGRRSRSVKWQPEVAAPKPEGRKTSPVKKELKPEVRLEEATSSAETSTVLATKNKPQNSEAALDIRSQSPTTDAAETKGRKSRSVKFQPEVAALKREGRKTSPVKRELKPEVRLEEAKSSAEPSTVRTTKKKPRNSGPVLDVPPQSPITDAVETKNRRTSRSVKLQPKVAASQCDMKSPVKEYHADTLEAETLQESKSPQEPSKRPVLDVAPVRPKARSDTPNVITEETVDLVPKKLRKRNVEIDDIELISRVEDGNDGPKKSGGTPVIPNNQTSVVQKVVVSKPKERLEEILVRDNSSSKIAGGKNRIPDFNVKSELIDKMDDVCFSDRLRNTMQNDGPVPEPAKEQESLKTGEENGMLRLSVRLEKMNDTVILDTPPEVKRPRGRPRLSELIQASANSHLDSLIANESMKTEKIDLLGDDGKKVEKQIPVKRKRGRPKLSLKTKLERETDQTIDLSIKSEDELFTPDQIMIEDVDNSCSGKGLESKNEAVEDTDKNKDDESKSAVVAEPKPSLPSADISTKEKRTSGTFSAWKIRLKDVETEAYGLPHRSVDVDELPLSAWLESDISAADNDDSIKKSKKRSRKNRSKQKIKRTDMSNSERDVSAGLCKRKPKSDVEFLDARKIPIVNQGDLETLRLDARNVSQSDQETKKRNRMHINPANIKHQMLMNKELMVILKPLNETQLAQSTPKKSHATAIDSPVAEKLVPNPVHATQHRINGKFDGRPSPTGKQEDPTKDRAPSTETDTGDFQVGDIVWAKLGSYPFWPCMITKHPVAKCYKKYLGKLHSRLQYHVRFFGDNGQRAWVNKHCVMAYHERDDLEKLAEKLQVEMSHVKRNKSLKINVVSSKMSLKWHSGVNEAESLKGKSRQERLAHCFVPRKKKKSPNSDSWSEDEGKGSTRKRKFSAAEFVAAKRPRVKSPGKQPDDHHHRTPEEPLVSRTPKNAATAAAMTRRTSRGTTTRRDSLARSSTDDLASKEAFAPNSSTTTTTTTGARNKHLVVEGSTASDTDSKLSDISSVPTSLESQAALFKRNHLFRGVSKDKVCQICEKPGNVVTCSGPCGGIYHRDCAGANISKAAASTTQEREDDDDDDDNDENGDKEEQLPDDAKVEILTVVSNMDDSVVDLRPTPSLNTMTLAEKIDYRMRQIMKKFDYGASYTCGKPTTDPGENCASSTPSPQTAKLKLEETKSTPSPRKNAKRKPKEDMMQIIKHVTADNVSYKCVKKKIPNKSKSAEAVVNSSSSTPAATAITTTTTATATTTTTSTEFKCKWCTNGITPFCHSCNQETSKDGSAFRQRCSLPKCGKYYHPECLKLWPQTQWSITNTTQEKDGTYSTFICPGHVCHTCFSEDPRPGMQRCISKAAKCVRCPVTYHSLNHCVPAGTQLLSTNQIVCPRHYVSQPHPCNANWCFICSKGGDLICCERCPTSVHAECMPAGPEHPAAADVYYCEDCQSGRLPLYDEIVWVKMGRFRWWPAVILFPNEVPESVRKSKHEAGEFVAKFFGTYNHFWVHRGNVFLFQEGDKGGNSCSSRSGLDTNFNKAIEEAATAHQLKRQFKMNHLAGKRSHLKPPPYIKIKSNKPLGNVRMVDHNISNTTSCECDPSQPHPCGPDSDCLNRLLLTECNPEVCPAGERCNNQCFEKREYPPLAPNKTESRGWGLKTLAPLRKGQFVIEYVGEILDMDEYRRRVKQMHERKEENYYFLTIDNMRMLDAGPKGNLARFMNHSCQPNCETQKWTVNSDTRVGLFAKTDIPVDTELTFNYNLECIGKEKKECNCGAAKCSGFIGVKVKGDVKVSSKKKLGKKKKVKIPDVILQPCFECKKMEGKVGACNNKMCTKFYHLECAGLTAWPKGDKWVCSWHNCNFCLKRTIRCCIECTNSYCPPHAEGNVRYDSRLLGFICKEHDPLKSKVNSQQVTVLNGAKTNKKEKLTAQAAVRPSRRSLPARDKKKKLHPSTTPNFADNVVTSTPVKRLRDESAYSASGTSENCNALKKRKTEASTTIASLSIITTRKMARELNQTVPKIDLSAVKKRLRIKHENTL